LGGSKENGAGSAVSVKLVYPLDGGGEGPEKGRSN